MGEVATAAVGIAGIAATVWTQRSERRHGRSAASEDRTQARKQATYERLLKLAIEVTEFVGNADVIFIRDAMPPDVDVNSYDAWLVIDLYASSEFAAAYRHWQSTVKRARSILDEVPDKRFWHEVKGDLPDRFVESVKTMEAALATVIAIARDELS